VAIEEKNNTAKSSSSSSKSSGSKRKTSPVREKPKKRSAVYIFWLFFFMLVICLFIVNRGAIQTTLQNTRMVDLLLNRPVQRGRDALLPEEEARDDVPETGLLAPSDLDTTFWRDDPPETAPPLLPVPETPTEPAALLLEERAADPVETPAAPPLAETPAAAPSPPRGESAERPVSRSAPAPQKPPEARRERVLYLVQIDPDGTILRTKVTRNLPVTDSPLVDVLNVLLQGPSAEENSRGLISLIPRGTRVFSAVIRGSTAYINFNENFLFNEYGVEGYAGQLKQVVWTVTEFSNVKEVQILIEGRRMDYLGESIWIGSPIGRESR
jgi:spore germination protein GerM